MSTSPAPLADGLARNRVAALAVLAILTCLAVATPAWARVTSSISLTGPAPATYRQGSGMHLPFAISGPMPPQGDVLVRAWTDRDGATIDAFTHTITGSPWQVSAAKLDTLPRERVRLVLALRSQGKVLHQVSVTMTVQAPLQVVGPAVSFPAGSMQAYIRGSGVNLPFSVTSLPSGGDIMLMARPVGGTEDHEGFWHTLKTAPWHVSSVRLDLLPAGSWRIQLFTRQSGRIIAVVEHTLEILEPVVSPVATFPAQSPAEHLRGSGVDLAVAVDGEVPAGVVVEALAWSEAEKRMVSAFAHPLSAPWEIDSAKLDQLPDGVNQLQLVTRYGPQTLGRETHTILVNDPPAPPMPTVSFAAGSPATYEVGSGVSVDLVVDGEVPAGVDLAVVAWSSDTGAQVPGFAHTLTGSPWRIQSAWLDALPAGTHQLRVVVRENGEAKQTVPHNLIVTQPAPQEPGGGDVSDPTDPDGSGNPTEPTDPNDPTLPGGTDPDGGGSTGGGGTGGGTGDGTGDGSGDDGSDGEAPGDGDGDDGSQDPPPPLPQNPADPYGLNAVDRGEGWTDLRPSADSRIIYVSADGDDANDGRTPQTPVRTPARGASLLRHGYPDWLVFRSGDVFSSGLGYFVKSGRSESEMMVIGSYGPGARPRFETNGASFLMNFKEVSADYLAIVGIHAYDNWRVPHGPDFDPTQINGSRGISWLVHTKGLLVEDVVFEYFREGMVFDSPALGKQDNIRIRRSIIRNSYSSGNGHSQGLYSGLVTNLLVEECVFDHNGWNAQVSDAQRTIFNHNLYIQSDCQGIIVRRNIIARGSSHGLQLRPGGVIEDNLFVRNAIAFFTGIADSVVRNNVVLQSDDISTSQPRGWGITIMPCESAVVEGNIVAHRSGSTPKPAIEVVWESNAGAKVASFDVEIRNNVVHNWLPDAGRTQIWVASNSTAIVHENVGNLVDGGWANQTNPPYIDPNRDVASYMTLLGREGSLEAFLSQASARQASQWSAELTAPEVNAYVRRGFALNPSWD